MQYRRLSSGIISLPLFAFVCIQDDYRLCCSVYKSEADNAMPVLRQRELFWSCLRCDNGCLITAQVPLICVTAFLFCIHAFLAVRKILFFFSELTVLRNPLRFILSYVSVSKLILNVLKPYFDSPSFNSVQYANVDVGSGKIIS